MKNNCHVHTAPTDTDQLYIYKHVQSGENKLQPTPTGVTHWSNKLQQTSLLEFVGVCLCGVNWPLDCLPLRQCHPTFLMPNHHKDMPSIISDKHVFPIDMLFSLSIGFGFVIHSTWFWSAWNHLGVCAQMRLLTHPIGSEHSIRHPFLPVFVEGSPFSSNKGFWFEFHQSNSCFQF